MVSLVPDMPGDFLIDYAALEVLRRDIAANRFPMILHSNYSWYRADVAPGCLMLSGSKDGPRGAKWLVADLYSDGAGIFAANVVDFFRHGQQGGDDDLDGPVGVHDEEIVHGVISGLRFLARNAQDRARAGGDALSRARLVHAGETGRAVWLTSGPRGFGETMGRQLMLWPRASEAVSSLGALAAGGPDLVSAACLLTTDLFQQFGLPEALQITRDGRLRRQYWSRGRLGELETWAGQAEISITDQADLPDKWNAI
jgi:hypothetical protein